VTGQPWTRRRGGDAETPVRHVSVSVAIADLSLSLSPPLARIRRPGFGSQRAEPGRANCVGSLDRGAWPKATARDSRTT